MNLKRCNRWTRVDVISIVTNTSCNVSVSWLRNPFQKNHYVLKFTENEFWHYIPYKHTTIFVLFTRKTIFHGKLTSVEQTSENKYHLWHVKCVSLYFCHRTLTLLLYPLSCSKRLCFLNKNKKNFFSLHISIIFANNSKKISSTSIDIDVLFSGFFTNHPNSSSFNNVLVLITFSFLNSFKNLHKLKWFFKKKRKKINNNNQNISQSES